MNKTVITEVFLHVQLLSVFLYCRVWWCDIVNFYGVIETQVEVWENEMLCEHETTVEHCHCYFGVVPNIHKCYPTFLLLYRNSENMFCISSRKFHDRKKKKPCSLRSIKCKFSLLAPPLHQRLVPVLCF